MRATMKLLIAIRRAIAIRIARAATEPDLPTVADARSMRSAQWTT